MGDTRYRFPRPFGGISVVMPVPADKLSFIVDHMINGCDKGHRHNIAVEMDFEPPRIYTTLLGSECIRESLE